jgi:hypothetical protein
MRGHLRYVWGLGFPHVVTKGRPVGFDEAPFVVSNHIGVIEGAYLLSVFRASAVSALENTKVPILGRCVSSRGSYWSAQQSGGRCKCK